MPVSSRKILTLSILTLGFTSLVTQIILLREFLNIFSGNELVMGILFSAWMLLTGTGAFIAKYFNRLKSKLTAIIILQLFIGLLPLITVFTLYSFRNSVFTTGSMLSISDTILSSYILLIPYCIISGFLFTLFCQHFADLFPGNEIPKVYGLDVLGSIIGGIVFYLFLIFYFNTLQSLLILLLLNFLTAFVLSAFSKKTLLSVVILFLLPVFIFTALRKDSSLSKLYPGQEITFQKDTPYGKIVITKTEEQYNFYENGVFLFSTKNIIQKEEDVHYAMIQHKAPKYILLISGGISGTTDEILKYSPERIDYLELNPWLTKIAKHYNPNLSNPVINIINRDAILFLKEKNKEPETDLYDVALVNVPPPNSAQLNRFYTIEFFRLLKKHLADDAVISISLPSTADYVTPEARRLNSSLYSTLSKTFKNILIVPGNKNYFIASDSNLNINIADMIQHSAFNIQNTYVNQYYLDDYLLKQRSDFIKSKIVNHTSEINTDFSPVAYYLQLRYWLSLFKITNYKLLITIFILCLAFCIIFLFLFNIQHSLFNINFSLFTTGFAASSLQFLLLVYFQVFYGYVYMMTGILITLFMFGLAAGTFISGFRFPAINMKNFTRLNFGLGIYSIAIPLILYLLKNYNISSVIIQIIFFIIIIDIGTLTGMIFAFAVKLQNDTVSAIASRSYSIDLLGSAIGVLLVSAFFLPLFGLVNVSLLVASLCLLSGLILILSKKKV